MPKVILIQPTQYDLATGKPRKQSRIYLTSLALPLLAAYTPEHWEVKIMAEVVEDIDFDEECDLVGIGTMGHAVYRAIDIAKAFRERGKTVFMGGYMASIVPELVSDCCDSVVIGDAEISYPQLLKDFETTGKIKPIYNHQLESLENSRLPKYELLLKKKMGYLLPVQAGRGCPHSCSFCSIACIYKGRHIVRPIDEVMRDIKYIKALGYNRFYLVDDNIVANPDYLFELAKQIKPLKMQWASQCTILIAKNERLLKAVVESGCMVLSFGIESLSQEGLDSFGKSWVRTSETAILLQKIQRAGIVLATEMVIGADCDTEASLKATAEFIVKNKIPTPRFHMITPVPGTQFYKELKKEGRLLHDDYQKYSTGDCVFMPKNFTPETLEKAYLELYKTVYSYRNILKRTIFNRGFLKRPALYLFTFFINLVSRRAYKKRDGLSLIY